MTTPNEQPVSQTPSGIELKVCADIAARQRVGIAKYGMTLEQNPADFKARLTHAYQESIDQSLYLKWAIEGLEIGESKRGTTEPQSALGLAEKLAKHLQGSYPHYQRIEGYGQDRIIPYDNTENFTNAILKELSPIINELNQANERLDFVLTSLEEGSLPHANNKLVDALAKNVELALQLEQANQFRAELEAVARAADNGCLCCGTNAHSNLRESIDVLKSKGWK